MKSIILWLLAAAICAAETTLTATWNANSEGDLAGYIIYMGESSDCYTEQHDVGDTTAATISWDDKPLYMIVKAYDFSGNVSAPSIEASWIPHQGNPYDLNDDGIVDIDDEILLSRHLGRRAGSKDFNPALDYNGDGMIDIDDEINLIQHLGERQ